MSNVELNAGTGGAVLGTDTVAGTPNVEFQVVKIGVSTTGNAPTQVSTTNPLPISDAGGSVTVDGTITANAGTGTFAISAASLPLPTGAATAAKQPALGTAGSASTDVISVQGIASMTPLLVNASGNAIPVTDNAGTLTVDAPVGTPVFVRLSDGSAAITTLPVSLASVPSHAVTNAGTFAVQAAQSGTWTSRTQDGSGNAITSATRGSERALTVQIVDGTGTQVTSFSGSGTASAVSSVNSTTSTLLAAAAFTGTSEDITAYASVTVSVIASHASATDGLSMQQSSDGTNWDIVDVYTVPAATGKTFGVQVTAKFFRVVYTNGGTNQSSFRLQTMFHTNMPNASSVRPQDARSNENDMQEIISYLAGYNGTTWDRLRSDTTNGLDVDVTRVSGTVAVTQSGAWSLSANQSVNVAQINGVTPLMGNGVTGTGSQRVTIASDNTAFSVNAVQSGTWTVQPGNTANTTPWLTTDTPATSGGLSFVAVVASAATNNKTQVKASAGQLYCISAQNLNAAARYLKVFNNTSAGVTMGTTAADYQFIIPGATTGAGLVLNIDKGIAMGTGITIAVTGGIGATDNTSISANEVTVLVGYK